MGWTKEDDRAADARAVGEPAGDDARSVVFQGDGEMARRCRELDWARTPLGPVDEWPASLRAIASMVVACGFPMVALCGPELVQVYNDAYRELMGVKHPAGLGQPTRECWPEVWHINAPAYARVRQGETVGFVDALFPLTRSGTLEDAWFTLSISPLRDERGDVAGILVTALETTAEHRARDAREVERDRLLAASEKARGEAEAARERTEAVLASIADAFYLLDREWRFIYVNDAAEPLLQTTRDALLGRTLWEAFPGVMGSPFEGPYREAMAGGQPTSAEAYFPPLGTWFDVHSYPWPGGLMVHFRDIGARKAAEGERERLLADAQAARMEAEAANRAKGEFLATMSHELRTPLNAIGGYAELMELGIHGPVTPQQRVALDRIQRSQRALLSVINEVLNYARLESGAVTYDITDVPVAEVVGAAAVLVAPQLRAKGLAYAWNGCDPELAVRADRDKLQQVLLNLLSNAVKFTDHRDGEPGRVEVSCAVEPAQGGDGARVLIRVRDTGVGIPAEKLGAVFEPFVQVDQRLTREHSGTGLGLAISRDLARAMDGELVAESEAGVGSTFTLALPATRVGRG